MLVGLLPAAPAGASWLDQLLDALGLGGGSARLTAVSAVSEHRVLLTFDRPPAGKALEPSSFRIVGPTGLLPVTAVQKTGVVQAVLSTGAQQAALYWIIGPSQIAQAAAASRARPTPSPACSAPRRSPPRPYAFASQKPWERAPPTRRRMPSAVPAVSPSLSSARALECRPFPGDPHDRPPAERRLHAHRCSREEPVPGEYLNPDAVLALFQGTAEPATTTTSSSSTSSSTSTTSAPPTSTPVDLVDPTSTSTTHRPCRQSTSTSRLTTATTATSTSTSTTTPPQRPRSARRRPRRWLPARRPRRR